MTDDRARVQLGFALPLGTDENDYDDGNDPEILGHRSPRWSDWDGGKIGGVPSWLNPRDLPGESPLRCRGPCGDDGDGDGKKGTALRFVAQLYCPADDDAGNDAAFHRSLYVFACPTCCVAASSSEATTTTTTDRRRLLSNCVRVLRCQLPKRNDFYPPTCDDLDDDCDWTMHTSRYWSDVAKDDTLNLCAVSGQRSRGRCPRQNLWFCCPEHQRERLRDRRRSDRRCSPVSVFAESELVVEEEPYPPAADDDAASKFEGALFPTGDAVTAAVDEDVDDDTDLTQSDLNAMTGNMALTGVTDPITLAFYHRMNVGGDENDVRGQCMRYLRWPGDGGGGKEDEDDEDDDGCGGVGPLWLSSSDRPPPSSRRRATTSSSTNDDDCPTSFPPPCQYCGALRDFEFQILPQMLSFLTPPRDGDDPVARSGDAPTESEFAVLMEAHAMIESGMDLPAGFREQHDEAVANARGRLLGAPNGSDGGIGSPIGLGMDWGAIAVYTCTSSCGGGGVVSEENGCYREEVAWMQPPLD